MDYFLQLATNPDEKLKDDRWELVDQYTYDNWANALTTEGQPRYNGTRFSKNGDGIAISGEGLTNRDLAVICRILDVKQHDAPSCVTGGFYKTPEFIKFQTKNNKVVLHEINGETYNINKKTG